MKSKIFVYLPTLLLLFFSMACSDDPVSPGFSIEDKINSNRPFDHINIFDNSGTYIYSNSTGAKFKKAYAANGFLVIERENNETKLYNLSSTKEIQTFKGYVGLNYR